MYKYCQDIVKRHDIDRYVLSLAANAQHRSALWALFAFAHEIAKTREVVTDTRAGLIRLTWWRDVITAIYDGGHVPEHGVCQPLAKTIRDYDLPRPLFENLIYAREFDLEGVAPDDLNGLINYTDLTNTPLLTLCDHIIGSEEKAETIKALGIAYGLIGILRSLPFHAQINKCLIPADRLAALRLAVEQFHHLKPSDDLNNIVKDILVTTHTHTESAKPKNNFFKAAQKMLRIYEHGIKKYDYDVFDQRLSKQPPFLAWRVLFF